MTTSSCHKVDVDNKIFSTSERLAKEPGMNLRERIELSAPREHLKNGSQNDQKSLKLGDLEV